MGDDSPMSDTPEIDPTTAAAKVEAGEALLLDVREDDEWAAGHAPGAQHVRLGDLQPAHDAGSIPNDRPIVAICRAGGRSEKATIALNQAGYDVVNLVGGMQAWAAAGQPVVTDEGTPGTVI
jgi:rhodanese-related sulfurtransferase